MGKKKISSATLSYVTKIFAGNSFSIGSSSHSTVILQFKDIGVTRQGKSGRSSDLVGWCAEKAVAEWEIYIMYINATSIATWDR